MAEKEAQKIKTQSDYLSDSESSEDEVNPHLHTSQEERVYGTIVRHNLTVHCSVTPFVIWQPMRRPCLLERVYKPMRTSH